MNPNFRSFRFRAVLLVMALLTGMAVHRWRDQGQVVYPAVEKLAGVQTADRWSHPEMTRIRELGAKAVPSLRSILREKDSSTTRFLFWVKGAWPGATKYYSHFPDMKQLTERRWAACQAVKVLGPVARPAVPEIIEILKSKDPRDLNAAIMALWAIGVDAEICEQLATAFDGDLTDSARGQIVGALGLTKPPSARTLQVLTAALTNSYSYVQTRAMDSVRQLGVGTPAILAKLRNLQASSTNNLVVLGASSTLWELTRDSSLVLPTVFTLLERELPHFAPFALGGTGGQAVSFDEQLFTDAGRLFQRMTLNASERARALAILESCFEKSRRIFIRMSLLPAMMDLGYPGERCVEVCQRGLSQFEDYYRIQAARLLVSLAEKHSIAGINPNELLQDKYVGVRVYAARVHWLKNQQAAVVVPVLIDALDESKHQSYYYPEIQTVALKTLADIGTGARAGTGSLEKLLHQPNPATATLASNALAKIAGRHDQ